MSRRSFASLIVASVLAVSSSSAVAMAAEGKLKVGDPAPPLAVSTWLHGAEVKGFEPGKVYVVEFWATWCGPCRQIMPHMGDLQDEYRDKGVTFIGFASEANDKEAKVNAFVAKQGAKLGYTFAFGSGTETHNAYMKASGQNGIPCSFVVDKKGRIAYIGHPLFLDVVLPKVLDGTWDPKTGAETLAAADKDFDAAYAVMMTTTKGADAGLEALAKFAAKWPALANNVYMIQSKLGLLVRAKQFPEAKTLAEKLIARSIVRGDTSGLRAVSTALRDDSAKGNADLTALATQGSRSCVRARSRKSGHFTESARGLRIRRRSSQGEGIRAQGRGRRESRGSGRARRDRHAGGCGRVLCLRRQGARQVDGREGDQNGRPSQRRIAAIRRTASQEICAEAPKHQDKSDR